MTARRIARIKSPANRGLALALAAVIGASGLIDTAAAQRVIRSGAWTNTGTRAYDVSRAYLIGYVPDNEPVSIALALNLRNEELMDSYIAEQHRPGSIAYHQWMSDDESTEYFSPTQEQAQAVADYLTQMGYSHVEIAENRLVITAEGTAGTARRAFNTEIARFARNGSEGIANVRDAQLPASIAGQVKAVLGLQTLDAMRTYSHPQPAWLSEKPAPAKGTTSGGLTYYYPQEFATIYHAGTTVTGRSTTAAIVGWGSMTNTVNDLSHFETDYHITAVPIAIVTVGTASTDNSGEPEWALDAQAMVGISGGLKKLIFYAASNANYSSLLTTINRAVSDNLAKVVNMSWGSCESSASGWADAAFKTGVTHGQTFSVSSGDNGAYTCYTGSTPPANGSYGSVLAVSDPANSPYVIAIGGTTVTTNSASGYVSEAAWPYGGGGISTHEAKPSWQTNVTGSYRQLPDLAFDADWQNSGMAYYLSNKAVPTAGYYINGGTSLASPLFAGAWARLESAHSNSIGFAPKALYAYASTFPFHDVTSGSNGYYAAKTGWDDATGWGSFDIQAANAFITKTTGFTTASNK